MAIDKKPELTDDEKLKFRRYLSFYNISLSELSQYINHVRTELDKIQSRIDFLNRELTTNEERQKSLNEILQIIRDD